MAGTTVSVQRAWSKRPYDASSIQDPLLGFYTQINNLVTDAETVKRVLSVNTTVVGNVGAGVDDLMSYNLPASKLAVNGAGVLVRAWGKTANNVTAKNLLLKVGTVSVLGTLALTASQAGLWQVEAMVFRTATDAQDISAVVRETTGATLAAGKQAVFITTGTEDDGAVITIKMQGEGGADNDVTQEGMIVEYIPTTTDLVAASLSDLDNS